MKTSALLAMVVILGFATTTANSEPVPPPPHPPPLPPAPTESPSQQQAKRHVEFSPVLGYQWWGSLDVVGGELDIANSTSYGALIDIQVLGRGDVNSMIELMYLRQDTSITLASAFEPRRELFDLSVEHFQVGFVGELVQQAGRAMTFVPFLAGTGGFTRYAPKNIDFNDEFELSGTFGAGVKMKFNRYVGLRAHGRVITTLINSSTAYFCGASGCAVSRIGTTIFQGELSGTLVIAF